MSYVTYVLTYVTDLLPLLWGHVYMSHVTREEATSRVNESYVINVLQGGEDA